MLTFRPPRRLTRRLHGRQRDRHERADDGDHREQLDECETRARTRERRTILSHGKRSWFCMPRTQNHTAILEKATPLAAAALAAIPHATRW
jgi:hypothetical protein